MLLPDIIFFNFAKFDKNMGLGRKLSILIHKVCFVIKYLIISAVTFIYIYTKIQLIKNLSVIFCVYFNFFYVYICIIYAGL